MILEALIPHVLSFIMAEIKRRQDAGLDPPTAEELHILLYDQKLPALIAQADDFLRSKGIDPEA